MTTERIVVPLDFSDRADRALPVARALGDRIGARLTAVVVTSPRLDPDLDRDEARWHARRAGCRLDDVVLRGDDDVLAGILAAAASPADLLCLATGAHGAVVDLVARSVGEQVLCRSRRPVLAVGPSVPPGPARPVGSLLCCVDDEPELTARLLDVTAGWAATLGCTAHLMRVVPPGGGARPGEALAARESLDVQVRRLWARGVPATSGLVTADDVSGAIVRCAARRPGTAVVLAGHGRSRLRRAALGGVTLDVLRRSPAPVLVVPAGVAPAGGALLAAAPGSAARTTGEGP